MPIGPVGSTNPALGTALTSLGLLQQIGVTATVADNAADTLRAALGPLHGNATLVDRISLSEEAHLDLQSFLEGNHSEPSQALLQALGAKVSELRPIVLEARPELFAGSDAAITITGKTTRSALDYEVLSDTARLQRDAFIHEAVDRILQGMNERSRVSTAATPKAISLNDVLEHPENFRGKTLEIALFDVDGTTHKGETFFEGQYSIEWLLRDVLRHGPKATAGISWLRLLKAIPGIIKLRQQEKKHAKQGADKNLFAETFRPILEGLDANLARESIERFYTRYGRRGASDFMREEFLRHREKNRLIIGVSASLEVIVKLHAKDMGIPEENMLGTHIHVNEKTGKATGDFRWLHGEEKVVALEEKVFKPLRDRGIQFKLVAGYSDSPSDKPMLGVVKQDGGVAYVMNASKEGFKAETLADGGIAVEEEDGWLNNGVRQMVFATSETGMFLHNEKTPKRTPAWAEDLWKYGGRVFSDGAGAALAAPVSQAAHQAMTNGGHTGFSADLFASAPMMAVGAMIGSGLSTFLVPPDGPVSWWRRVLLRGMFTMGAAMVATGNTASLAPMMAALFVASAGAEAVTIGERAVGLRRWRGGDERKNSIGRTFGFWGLRSLQFTGYRAMLYLLQRVAGA